jgi:translation initiation factor IF-2
VAEGYECGMGLEGFADIQVGDLVEVVEVVESARTL